ELDRHRGAGLVPNGLEDRLPDRVPEAEDELDDLAHREPPDRLADGGRIRLEADAARLVGRRLEHAERERDDRPPRTNRRERVPEAGVRLDLDPAVRPPHLRDDGAEPDRARREPGREGFEDPVVAAEEVEATLDLLCRIVLALDQEARADPIGARGAVPLD